MLMGELGEYIHVDKILIMVNPNGIRQHLRT